MSRTARKRIIHTFVAERVMAAVSDHEVHDSPRIAAQIAPALIKLIEEVDRVHPGEKEAEVPTAIRAKNWFTRIVRDMIHKGVVEEARFRVVKGQKIISIALPGVLGAGMPGRQDVFNWRDTLEGFQRQARFYLETKQFDKMGLG